MSQQLAGSRLLLVEDEFMILIDLQTQLEDEGADVVTATTVADGMRASSEKYDAAVLDVRLPDGEVYPVAEKLADREVPLIFHSGHAGAADLETKFPNSVALSKPVSQPVLIKTVTRQISSKSRET